VKKISLELGGNAPFIVFDSADLDLAVQGCIAAKFRNAGQTCVSANRILVQSAIHDKFVTALKAAVDKQIILGNGKDATVTQVCCILFQVSNDMRHQP
jgi:succinate-semialdehyde dehydrogenase/glutarate-semialdehyde dehydrogenase